MLHQSLLLSAVSQLCVQTAPTRDCLPLRSLQSIRQSLLCVKQAIHLIHISVYMSIPITQIIPLSFPSLVSFCSSMPVSLFLPRQQVQP